MHLLFIIHFLRIPLSLRPHRIATWLRHSRPRSIFITSATCVSGPTSRVSWLPMKHKFSVGIIEISVSLCAPMNRQFCSKCLTTFQNPVFNVFTPSSLSAIKIIYAYYVNLLPEIYPKPDKIYPCLLNLFRHKTAGTNQAIDKLSPVLILVFNVKPFLVSPGPVKLLPFQRHPKNSTADLVISHKNFGRSTSRI